MTLEMSSLRAFMAFGSNGRFSLRPDERFAAGAILVVFSANMDCLTEEMQMNKTPHIGLGIQKDTIAVSPDDIRRLACPNPWARKMRREPDLAALVLS